MLIVYKHKNMI